MGRLARHWTTSKLHNSEAAIERGYRYDKAGNLLIREDQLRGNTQFNYDPTGRILAAKGRIEEYFEFDPAGNIQPPGLGAFAIAGNRLEVFQDLRYEYDVHGNVTSRRKGAHEEAEFTWNTEHQLEEAKVTRKGTEQTTRYEYDALGRRTRKIDTFGVTEYLWDGDLMIESRRNNKQALFLFEPDSFVPLATIQDSKTYWYQCDQIGAPQELTDQEGQIVWAADYKVWGEATLRKTGTDGLARASRRSRKEPPPVLEQPFRFQGQVFDEETGLHYNRFRYYDPGVGRFVSQDPIGLRGGSNLFAYAPNPTVWVDPFGLAKRKKDCSSCSGEEECCDLKKEAEVARDSTANQFKRKHATYAGGYKDGKVVSGCSNNPMGCAEDDIARQLGSDAQMTGAKGWRRNKATGELEYKDIPVCKRCQSKFKKSQFPADVKYEPGGAWSE